MFYVSKENKINWITSIKFFLYLDIMGFKYQVNTSKNR